MSDMLDAVKAMAEGIEKARGLDRQPLEYTERVGEAGDRYIRSLTANNRCPLPATFRWEELFRIMQEAATDATELVATRWVNCELCGGSGEVIRSDSGAHQCDSYNEPCSACGGTGRECVETSPADDFNK